MTEQSEVKCDACSNPLVGEELERPYHDGDRVICDECYYRDYSELCEFCENSMALADIKYVSLPFGDTRGIAPGIYEILKTPFYITDCIGSFEVITGHVKKVADVPKEEYDNEDLTGGYVCDECIEKLKKEGRLRND